jgi:hypothetical protein
VSRNTTSTAPERERAFHEAGHAVMAVHLGLSLRAVTIVPNERRKSGGHARAGYVGPISASRLLSKRQTEEISHWHTVDQIAIREGEKSRVVVARWRKLLLMAAAGQAAVDLLLHHSADFSIECVGIRTGGPSSSDDKYIMDNLWLCDGYVRGKTKHDMLCELRKKAMRTLKLPAISAAVNELACALVERKTLDGQKVRAIYKGHRRTIRRAMEEVQKLTHPR